MGVDTIEQTDQGVFFHLHLSDSEPSTEEEITLADGKKAKVLWKDILVEGEYPMSPDPKGGASEVPMSVVVDGPSDMKTKKISMADLLSSHEEGAFKYVTIPTSHRDGLLDNTGYIPKKGLRKRKRDDGKTVLQAALGFTEPDIKGKVQRGTIPDVSAGVLFGPLNKAKKKRFRCALKHVALTPTPFMGNLTPFEPIFASDDEIDDNITVEHYYLADDDSDSSNTNSGEIVWDEKDSFNTIRRKVEEALRPPRVESADDSEEVPRVQTPSYYVIDVDRDDKALVEEYFKGKSTKFVVPFTRKDDGEVSVSPALRWTEVKEAMVAASDTDFEDMSIDKFLEKLRVSLGDTFGDNADDYKIDNISVDHRAKITKGDGEAWIANFSIHSDGVVHLSHPSGWSVIELNDVDDHEEEETSKPKTCVKSIELSHNIAVSPKDPLEARLAIARENRRRRMTVA